MRSNELSLDTYRTDKIANGYLDYYDPILLPLVHQPISLLELGVKDGGSLDLWRDYFPNGTIAGIDLRAPAAPVRGDRVHFFQGSQTDSAFLSRVAQTIAPAGFDIIIDDASHVGDLSRQSFWFLFKNCLKPGGLYVIEDWGTGYFADWPDGRRARLQSITSRGLWSRIRTSLNASRRIPLKFPLRSHSYGMVGFIKELVDEQGATDLTRGMVARRPGRPSAFESLLIVPSLVFVRKRLADDSRD